MFINVFKIQKENFMDYKKQFTIPLILMSLSTFSFATVYSDGEDGTVGNWHVYDNKPAGAVVSNVIDDIKNSKVIEFKGEGRKNSYMLGSKDWSNITEKNLSWSMNFSEKFKITVYIKTKKGVRTLFYDYKNKDKGLYKKKYIKIGLGERSLSGTWQNVSRDIEADLQKYEPDNTLIKIKGMKVQGSGRMDDILLEKKGDNPCLTRKELDSKIQNKDDLTKLDTSCIKDMSNLFLSNKRFNQDISNWDVSNVTNMSNMFNNADAFNQPLEKWDVSSVTNINGIFAQTARFNQPLGKWNLSNVSNMEDVFRGAVAFNQPIDNWDVSNVSNMKNMFYYALAFNQSLQNWDVSNVKDMYRMFDNARKFENHDLTSWNVENVETYDEFFRDAGNNNIAPKWGKNNCLTRKDLDLKIKNNEDVTKVDTSCIKDMSKLFLEVENFNQDIGNWDVSNVTNMVSMFHGAKLFNKDIGKWDVSKVTDMSFMFERATHFDQEIGKWDVSNVENMTKMFRNSTSFNKAIGEWDVSNVTNMHEMFYSASFFNKDIGSWNVSNVTDMHLMFSDTSFFSHDIGKWDVSNVTDVEGMLSFAKNYRSHDLSGWNVQKVIKHKDFFKEAGVNNIEPIWVQ